MKSEIINKFLGTINGVEITNEIIYYSTEFLLEQIENKFGEIYNKEFVEDLSNTIETMYLKYDEFSFSDLENEFYYCIKRADNFNDIQFEYFGLDWKITDLNESISEGKYTENTKVNWNKKDNIDNEMER
ncbi:hypothetical protein STFE110948_02510 [Streptobacillus felis]|uniref:hypothetical protein n=1 Tax=Streptobacillus felis TaxID=1384509 RepID=UPI0008329BD7|nr:hypothetical protein [Streptobacillus felis]